MYDLFSDFFEGFDIYPVYRNEVRCKKCNTSYSEFQKTGRLGCSECYNTFSSPLEGTMKQIHSNTEHKGKVPKSLGTEITKRNKIKKLKEEIQTAVAKEDYETAAKLHKELKELNS